MLNVLGLATYPVEAAATRYRLTQYIKPLAERGVTLRVRPFLDSGLFASLYRRQNLPRLAIGLAQASVRRVVDFLESWRADVVFVQREAMMFGPPLIEWLATKVAGCP